MPGIVASSWSVIVVSGSVGSAYESRQAFLEPLS